MHRARAFFAAHGIEHIHRIVTDNGACYRAKDFVKVLHGARHQRITPYTPRHNGKVERYNRILAEEFLYARAPGPAKPNAPRLCRYGISTTTTTGPTPHSATGRLQASFRPCHQRHGLIHLALVEPAVQQMHVVDQFRDRSDDGHPGRDVLDRQRTDGRRRHSHLIEPRHQFARWRRRRRCGPRPTQACAAAHIGQCSPDVYTVAPARSSALRFSAAPTGEFELGMPRAVTVGDAVCDPPPPRCRRRSRARPERLVTGQQRLRPRARRSAADAGTRPR